MKTKGEDLRESAPRVTAKGAGTRVPRLRFPEFRDTGGWIVVLLNDVAELKNGYAFKSEIYIEQGQYRIITIANVQNGEMNEEGMKEIAELPNDIQDHQFVFPGDILVSMTGNVGRICRAVVGNGLLNQRVGKIVPQKILNEFLFQELKSQRFLYTMQGKAKGAAQGNLSSMDILEFDVFLPKQSEQIKIAACLSSLDELIAAHSKKLEALRAYKNGLMQRLFPAEGEKVPKLRFPEFRDKGNWGERLIGEMVYEVSRSIDMKDDQQYSLVTVKRRYGGLVSRGIYRGKDIAVKSQFLINGGDFLISKRQIVHNACGLVPQELAGSIVSNEYSVLMTTDECDVMFLNYWAQQPIVSMSFLHCSIGIHIEKMLFKIDQWLAEKFLFPSLFEQRVIADTLSSLDDLIAAEARQLEALKVHKKGLMQGLFPQAGGEEI